MRSLEAPLLVMIGDDDFVRLEHALELFRMVPARAAGGAARQRTMSLPITRARLGGDDAHRLPRCDDRVRRLQVPGPMLSRTAENLYWLARYMERAETMARLLEVGYRMALMPSAGEGYRNEWASLVAAAGSSAGFEAKFGESFRQRDVETWLFFDRENPSSVISCIETARQNGRAVRTALTTEMWDALNGAYLELARDRAPAALGGRCCRSSATGPSGRAALFRGATEGTHLQNDGYDFLNLGYYLERGDNTARLLDVKYYVLLPTTDMVGGSIDTYQWTTLLRALSAYRAFHWTYGGEYSPRKIAHFLILNRACPRSLLHCQDKAGEHLDRLARAYGTRTPAHERLHALLGELAEAAGRGHHRGGAARVPHPLHPPERGARPATSPTATSSGSSDAPERPPRHALPLRRADALRHPEPPADPGDLTPASGARLGRSPPRARCSAPASPTAPATASRR